mmetsp:Transcript_919/g.1942  ORF Transcript_919/g.1942 Transcript_919/m.1942 type:complete len:275 (-) Transcript_919:674-1498(-)|eukprot:CAMPEP_0197188946 /NCGR_PEP_ID=MMETSP1423-20130617/18840_1 /TAXON_ID=476441 /ORGANISM="Pseudo-nitzschia heimii, Strain UNC1101" /LENGTH=274 /DNA_ID=CAMNT_0042640937 /DNA_START=159 /DNA_END=983 /DNA_ORIENTATION=-
MQQQRFGEGGGGYRGSLNDLPLDCATSGYHRAIHDATTWRFLQETYLDSVDERNARGYRARRRQIPSYSGFNVAVEVRDDGHRGRSVYAMEPIARGTTVWDSTHLVRFTSPIEMRAFLGRLDHDLQCDALLWAYVEKDFGYVSLALDPASFVNHGESEDVINLDADCNALRDIEVGEELLENYTHFIGFEEDDNMWFNRIRGVAWKEGGPPDRARSTNEYNLLGAPKTWGSGDFVVGQSWPIKASFLLLGGIVLFAIGRKLVPAQWHRKQKNGI